MSTANGFDFDICQRKHGGNANSNAAFDASKDKHSAMRDRIFRMIEASAHGITSREAQERLDPRPDLNAISGRFSEMSEAGLIEQVGRRGNCGVWHVKRQQVRMF